MRWQVLSLSLLPFSTLACDLFSSTYDKDTHSVMYTSQAGLCVSMLDTYNFARTQLVSLNLVESDPTQVFDGDYWSEWSFDQIDDPFITQNLASNYFGLGVWLPSDLAENVSTMSTDEWLRSHGLQFSVGFGDKKLGEPRMRLDYRWHEDYDGDIMMQVEVPF